MQSESSLVSQTNLDFSLRKVVRLFEKYAPPPLADFKPEGDWKQEYTVFLLEPTISNKHGAFLIERSRKGTQDFTLTVQYQSLGISGFSLFEHSKLQCRADTLASPVSWQFSTKMSRRAKDKPYLLSGRKCSANVSNGVLTIRDSLHTRKTEIHGLYSTEWTLLEAVQRLPGKAMENIHYTLIDEYDTPEPGHSLAFYTQASVTLLNGPMLLTAYRDLGRAVIPTVYWVDEHGRLIFVCTGLVAYVLAATNGHRGECPNIYPAFQNPRRQRPRHHR